MRLIDADELLINVWRDKPNDTVSIAKMINDAPTIKDIPTKEEAEPIVDLDRTRIFMIGILLGYDQKHDEMDKFTEDIKRIFAPKPKTDLIDKIKAEIREWYWQADKQELAKDPCVVDAMVDLFIRTIDKYKVEGSDPG